MRGAQDLLLLILLAAIPFAVRPRPPPSVSAPGPRPICPVVVEGVGVGVGCLSEESAHALGIRAGDLVQREGDGRLRRTRMAPARLAAWAVPVDVNRASLDELASLDGVGPKLAARIAAARPFVTVSDVSRVRGIGPKRLVRLADRLTVSLDD